MKVKLIKDGKVKVTKSSKLIEILEKEGWKKETKEEPKDLEIKKSKPVKKSK